MSVNAKLTHYHTGELHLWILKRITKLIKSQKKHPWLASLNRVEELKAFLLDDRIEIYNNSAENAIRLSVTGHKNWLFSVSEAGAKANAICLSLTETAKASGIYFYQCLVKLPNLSIHQQTQILQVISVLDLLGYNIADDLEARDLDFKKWNARSFG